MRRAGLSRAYVSRVMRELEDHTEDLGRDPDAEGLASQLGNAPAIVDALVEQVRDGWLFGRRTWVAFVLLPTFVASLALIVFLVLGIPLPIAFGEAGRVEQDTVVQALRFLALIGVRGIPSLFAVVFGWLAVRRSLGARAIWMSGLMLSLLGASLQYRVSAPVPGQSGGEFMVDVNLLQPNLPGLLLPLVCCLVFTLLDVRRRRTWGSLHT